MSMKEHIIKIFHTAYFELKCFSSVPRFLTADAIKTLVTSYILSWPDCCNCLLMGELNSVIQPLQKVQNFVATHGTLSSPLYPSPAKAALASHFRVHKIQSCMHVLPCYKWFWSYLPLWTPTYLHSILHALLSFRLPHAQNPTIQTQDSWLSHFLLLWTPHLEFTSTRLHLFKRN